MSLPKPIKVFQRALARWGLFFFAGVCAILPLMVVRGLASILIAIGSCFTIKQRKLAQDSLQVAFGSQKNEQEIQQIIKKCFSNLGHGMMEMLYFMAHPKRSCNVVSFEGLDYLDQALLKRKGVIAVTAHFGNFPLMMMAVAQRGYHTNGIIRTARDQKLEHYLLKKRTESELKTVYAMPRKACVEQSMTALRNNEVLFIPLDHNFGSGGGVFVDFFGQKAATATGPIVFAKRTGATILPIFTIRGKNGRHKIIIEPPLTLEEGQGEQETLLTNTQKLTTLIEQYIRRYPHEWGWMHRRWKTKQ